jgi:hypothetical protein
MKPLAGGDTNTTQESVDEKVLVTRANTEARVAPTREGYVNAIQVWPYTDGALYQVYAAPGQITAIALEHGESLTGAGPIAAGDTARWIIGDTESGSGITRRVHVLVKPTRPDITTNLVITTDRRIYMIELRSGERPYMPAVAWAYPRQPGAQRPPARRRRQGPMALGRATAGASGQGRASNKRKVPPRGPCAGPPARRAPPRPAARRSSRSPSRPSPAPPASKRRRRSRPLEATGVR